MEKFPNIEKAPDAFQVVFTTTAGDIVFDIHRDWSPHGVDRFHALLKQNFFSGVRFFRVVRGFVAQFGIHPDPEVASTWRENKIPDDPVKESNQPGTLTFATSGTDSRTTQMFINMVNNSRLDDMGFSPIGQVSEGLDVVQALYADYGEGAPSGLGPEQHRIQEEGESYLAEYYPELDKILEAVIRS